MTLGLWICCFGLVENEILQLLSPKDQAREFRPCVNLHPVSAFVELCVTDVCFLHIQHWHKCSTSENAQVST